eukprot:TRINITY_DN31933_c0_g1_i1.p1 TRINITY_DN31933_c0_g1~~TRINITY_DN31933_c0_g1_i1.p1  ORF type:complete len:279 (-),score=51.08 TRINITY_DN31933_c0_g1_i1:229-1065(-)
MTSTVSRALLVVAVVLFLSSVDPAASLSVEDVLQFLRDRNELEPTPEQSPTFPAEEMGPSTNVTMPTNDNSTIIIPNSSQAANISRSRLVYALASGVPVSVNIPPSTSINVSVTVEGSFFSRAVLADDIDEEVDKIAESSPSSLGTFVREEREALHDRAGDKYFFFFQAAANFGYSNNERTRRMLESDGFERFNIQSAQLISALRERPFTGNFSIPVEIESTGFKRRITLQSFVYISELTLTSGEVLRVVSNPSRISIVDQHGNIYNDDHIVDLSALD